MTSEVYADTTAPKPKLSFFTVPNEYLDLRRLIIKGLEVLLSFVAFILEEVVSTCISCGPLYFFEFISCTAFLFTMLLVIMLATRLQERVPITCWPKLDLIYSGAIALFFFIASCVFAADNSGTDLEKAAAAFGFLATMAFIADVALMVKPMLSKTGTQQSSNGRAGSPAPAATEPLETMAPLNPQPE